jgi:hypothetical protein
MMKNVTEKLSCRNKKTLRPAFSQHLIGADAKLALNSSLTSTQKIVSSKANLRTETI